MPKYSFCETVIDPLKRPKCQKCCGEKLTIGFYFYGGFHEHYGPYGAHFRTN